MVKDRAALTELYLKSTKPISDKDFEGQFNYKHLNKEDQVTALKLFRKHKAAFSQHACDLGKSQYVKLKHKS